jgi:hypothetical protein
MTFFLFFAHREEKSIIHKFYQLMKSFPLNNITITTSIHMKHTYVCLFVCLIIKHYQTNKYETEHSYLFRYTKYKQLKEKLKKIMLR